MSGTRISSLLGKITILFVICCCCLPAQAKYGGGSGTAEDPYLIYTAEQMNAIGADANDWDRHFKLMADINLSGFTGTSFNIIGTGYFECFWFCYLVGTPFTGTFDGNGHDISNFTYSYTGIYIIGLFGVVDGENAEIKNLRLIDPNVAVEAHAGSLVGYLVNGTITDCYVEGGSVSGATRVGGLVGRNRGTITNCYSTGIVLGTSNVGGLVGGNSGTITNCYSTGSVSGNDYVGGLVGSNYEGAIANSYSTGSISATSYVGGLVGANSGTISNSSSTGSVSGATRVGGLVGRNRGTITNCYSTGIVLGTSNVGGLVGGNSGTITNCFSTGSVWGTEYTGGLVGLNFGRVTASFWDIETSGRTDSAAGEGKTTAEMQNPNIYIGWGCEPVWTIDEGADYPRLAWENKPGEVITNPSYWEGSGTETDPYLIYTAEELNTIGLILCDWDKHFKLMADIDLSAFTGTSFNIIGTDWDNPFTGVFDGNGHKISNFTYTSTGTHNIGLFGFVHGENALIKDLGLIDPDVDGGTRSYVGSLVGRLQDGTISGCCVEGGGVSGGGLVGGLVGKNSGTISNCYATTSVSSNDDYVGGLVGWNRGWVLDCCFSGSVVGDIHVGGLVGANHGTITNCYSFGSVSSRSYVGGLAGSNGGEISCCYSVATVTAAPSYAIAGGLVGDNEQWGVIFNCYSIGRVSGGWKVGGLVGLNDNEISNCYSAGRVEGSPVGGLVGDNRSGTITNAFWDMEASGQSSSDGGTGKRTTEMQAMSTFTDADWDFVGETLNGIEDIWFIPQGDYPHLWWQGMQVPMKLTPRTLNCRSKGDWVKAHLTLPQGFTVADVDADRPAVLHSFGFESAPLYVFVNENERVQIEAAFERQVLCSMAGDWPQMLTVAGFLTDGNIFLGKSTVRIIHPGMKVIEELAWYWLNADCVHPDFCDGIDMNRDSLVNLLDYALLMNINVEFVTDE